MNAKEMGTFISSIRKASGKTQKMLARELNVTEQAVSRWERGIGFPDISLIEPLAAALGIGVDELIYAQRKSDNKHEREEIQVAIKKTLEVLRSQVNEKKMYSFIFSEIILCFLGTISLLWAALSFFKTFFLYQNFILHYWGNKEVFVRSSVSMPYGYYFIFLGVIFGGITIIRMVIYLIKIRTTIEK